MSALKKTIEEWETIEATIKELDDFAQIAEQDTKLQAELIKEIEKVELKLHEKEFYLLLSGPHDRDNCFLSIHAGTGGVDAQDCAAILMRMYLRFADQKGFTTDVLQVQAGEEAGIKKATIEITGEYAYGLCKSEAGVHRIVRLSPFNAQNLRQTSFVLVEVIPVIEQEIDIKLNPDDLRIDTFKSSGAGGQHVNKTSSAVRITHKPTGLVVACQQERSQLQNKEKALKLLKAKLYQIEQEKLDQQEQQFKGEHKQGSWSNQIRSYVFHPYQMVKDHRTEAETSKIDEVINGDLDVFVEKYLEKSRGSKF